MDKITIYFAPDGSVTIRWPKSAYPDRGTLERLSELIREHKKSPSACANMQKGSTENGTQGQ